MQPIVDRSARVGALSQFIMPEVFISYGRSDRPQAERVAAALEERGWSVWWDRKILAGETFSHTIEKTLDEAKCVVVLWSASSVASSWVKDEATEGLRRNVLVPVLIDEVEIPLGFRQLQTVTLAGTSQDQDPSAFEELIAAVDSVLSRPSVKTSPEQPAQPISATTIRKQISDRQGRTAPRSYLYAALGVIAILAVLAVWGRFNVGTGPMGGNNIASADTPAAGAALPAAVEQTADSNQKSASTTAASTTGAPTTAAPTPSGAAPPSSVEVSDSPSDAAGVVVSGKGQDFFTLFDATGGKQLGYAKTDVPIEVFPGDYLVDLHGARRSVKVAPARRTNLASGTLSVSGTGADFFEVHDAAQKKQLAYAKTNALIELFPGDYMLVMHGASTSSTVRAGRDTTVAAGRLVVPGSGATFYTVYDAKGEKQLTYAKTSVEIELLPGAYIVEMNNTRRSAQVSAGNRTVVDR
jgi:hypothetical protein